MLTGDHTRGVANVPVTFTASSATWTACGAPTCILLTDSTGLASSTLTTGIAGAVQLQATAAAGSVSASLTVLSRTRSVTAAQPVLLVAEGTSFSWATAVTLADSAAPTVGVPVTWTGSPSLHFAATRSTAASITASDTAAVSPLGAGVTATGAACAWNGICANLSATGVSATELRLVITAGAAQSIALTGALIPVQLQVLNTAGLPVAGATVYVKQTLTAWQPPCPAHGRCGTAAVLGATTTTLSSDQNGLLTVQPETQPGVASTTTLGISTGTAGFATTSLERHP